MGRAEGKCAICGKPAIGMEIYGCCAAEVCREHASERLLALSPGERRDEGACMLWRYESG
ncbi:hypothetical protein [Methanofollis fontis]|uniref:Uncharacterized protein n=1 Tax=Methanofollis fontis TaxID=2052832 RepID=A0A483CS12_9EURY|nr:hypothetical protein [Methanofollis fontis]TAJ43845.1 hypothetical protein CUJ86_07190 [Methanofollis fontis]